MTRRVPGEGSDDPLRSSRSDRTAEGVTADRRPAQSLAMMDRIRVASASIAKGLVMTSIPGSRLA